MKASSLSKRSLCNSRVSTVARSHTMARVSAGVSMFRRIPALTTSAPNNPSLIVRRSSAPSNKQVQIGRLQTPFQRSASVPAKLSSSPRVVGTGRHSSFQLPTRSFSELKKKKNFVATLSTSNFSLFSSPLQLKISSIQKRKMSLSNPRIPPPYNEPMRDYAPNSVDAQKLREALDQMKKECPEIPCFVGGKEIKTGDLKKQLQPGNHAQALCTFHQADKNTLDLAIKAALDAKSEWEDLPWADRASVFLKAADLLAGKYRYQVLAATMLGQGKTVWQAEIDSTCETIDFWRWNVKYAEEIYGVQPQAHSRGVWNRTEYRPLEGFVVAISPFNFTAIGANLPTSPAMMGNVVLWKPASTAILSNYLILKILREAGLPDGVINFVPGSGSVIGDHLINHREFAGLHFTGSTGVFNNIMFKTAQNLNNNVYRSYPRIVGETGGKDFHIAHPNVDVDNLVNCTIRGAFEYQGQKCSATSRAYFPKSLWPEIKEKMVNITKQIVVSEPDNWKAFMGPVIDANAFKSIKDYIEYARNAKDAEIIAGGVCDDSKGYFIHPTIIVTTNPKFKTLEEEIFGPVLTIYVYEDSEFEAVCKLCDETSPYALTGSIFARDRKDVARATRLLRHTAGNFYINDKSTGAVVGQQPFGGARASGTNDKAGAAMNLMRWVSARSIKENFIPTYNWTYPHMD